MASPLEQILARLLEPDNDVIQKVSDINWLKTVFDVFFGRNPRIHENKLIK